MIVNVIRLIDANKAKVAFLAPLITAIGAAVASWIVTGDFNANEIRAAAGGAVLAAIAGVTTWLAPAGRAEVVRAEDGGAILAVLLALLLACVAYFVAAALGLPYVLCVLLGLLGLVAGAVYGYGRPEL